HQRVELDALMNGTWWSVVSPAAVPTNTWTHVAVTYDGTTLRLYVNATQVASAAASGSLPPTTQAFWFGQPWYSTWAGGLDEIRIYRSAISASAVTADMGRPADDRQAHISALTPSAGGISQSVTLTGVNFGGAQGSTTVTFNGTTASAAS